MPASRPSPAARALAAALLLSAAPLAAPLAAQAAPDVPRIETHRLRDGVAVLSGFANGNILVVEGDSGVLLVDGQSARRVLSADSALRALTRRPVTHVVNTHYHGDHTEGNAHWRAGGAAIVAHRAAAREAARDTTIAEWNGWHRTPLAAAAMPTQLVDSTLTIPVGAERVVVRHVPRAHTSGDLVVWLPAANVLHTGDLVEIGAYPFLDWWAGGTLDGMIAATDTLLAMGNDRTAYVPGHGRPVTAAEVREYRAMLVDLRARARAAVQAGQTLEQWLETTPTAAYDARNGGERPGRRFAALVYFGVSRGW